LLIKGAPSSVATALAAVGDVRVDSEGDGTADVAELRLPQPRNPSGARSALRVPLDSSALARALLVARYVGLRLRRAA
jgi:hypothetical protein